MRVRRRTLALALPVALVLGLGACSSDDVAPVTPSAAPTSEAPSETLTAEPTETPEPEPTEAGPTPPARPAAMDDTGKKGAQAAAEYFIELMEYSPKARDASAVEEIAFSTSCMTCQSLIKEAQVMDDNDYTVTGGATSLSEIAVSDKDQLTGGYAVSATFQSEEMLAATPAGKVVDTYEADSGYLQIDVIHVDGNWYVMSMVTDQGAAG